MIGLVGCGTIGTEIARQFKVQYVHDIDETIMKSFAAKCNAEACSLSELIEKSEIIIEAAHPTAVRAIFDCKPVDKKIVILSSIGIVENVDVQKSSSEVYVPSGAISGLDSIQAVSKEIESLQLITTKAPKSLEGAPFIVENNIDLNRGEKQVIFEGTLEKVLKGFPTNGNVAASLYLASQHKDITVTIIADPYATTNTHHIICKGSFGTIETITENRPSSNPKTSSLAIASVLQLLRKLEATMKIGT